MTQENLVYNPICDVQKVEQNGFVDLVKASQNNSIPANLTAQDLSFNGIDDPRAIGGRPRNQFDAAGMSKTIVDYKPPKND